jgi:hypothetical protein
MKPNRVVQSTEIDINDADLVNVGTAVDGYCPTNRRLAKIRKPASRGSAGVGDATVFDRRSDESAVANNTIAHASVALHFRLTARPCCDGRAFHLDAYS